MDKEAEAKRAELMALIGKRLNKGALTAASRPPTFAQGGVIALGGPARFEVGGSFLPREEVKAMSKDMIAGFPLKSVSLNIAGQWMSRAETEAELEMGPHASEDTKEVE